MVVLGIGVGDQLLLVRNTQLDTGLVRESRTGLRWTKVCGRRCGPVLELIFLILFLPLGISPLICLISRLIHE